ncbi:MAG: GAF domain-containing protein [Elusimicrobia bacterium]|nr:GAF domain-containing protein [Elusimicrobiota bacterium]
MSSTHAQTLELLLEIGKLLSTKLELSELLTSVLGLATRVVQAESSSLLLLDEKAQELYFDVALGLGEDAAKVRLKLGQGIAGSVAQNRLPEIINDVRKDPRWSPAADARSGFTTRSILAVPMIFKGRLIGVLEAINKRGGVFSEQDQRAFEAFASQVAVAIDNARLFSSLKEERFKLATVFSQMTDGAVLTDSTGRVLLANDASAKLLGNDFPDIGAGLNGMVVTPSLMDLLGEGRSVADFVAVRKEPTLLVLEGRSTRAPLAGREGRLFVFRDRTENWRQEKLKRTFLSLISHKLRTPLAAVTGFAEILMGEIDPEKEPLSAKAVRAISEQGAKVSQLVDKLLSYTTIESPDTQISPEPISADEAIGEAIASLQDKIAARGAKLDVAPAGFILMVERRMVVESIKNLIDNAVKFNPAPAPAVVIRVRCGGNWAELSVADNGPGVPPEDQERVFARFHQVEKDFTGQQDGLGLGLAYVRKVAELHGGSAVLVSKLNAGTTVTITLPGKRTA